MNASSYTENIPHITSTNSYKPRNFIQTELFVLKMAGRAIKLGGADVSVDASGALDMIDTFDRPGDAFAAGTYAGTGTYAEAFEDKPGKRIPKAGAYATAGVGHARAKGPNASAGVGASLVSGAKAYAKAEVASASASAGPLKATVGLAADTGVTISPTQIEAKVLGTSISIGRKMGVSLFDSGFEFELW